ncbi:MAG: methionyl-tRNA formyltransferase [Clostridiales bacterium]|nr:methionyl-tRNA formyltransferase [Clostridiales bacterium]
MRIVFLGTPEFGVPSLKALVEAGYQVVGVFTQPDKPKGRGNKMQQSPVKECALSYGIPVFQPVKIRIDGVEDLRALKPDLCVTAAFGQILSQEILDIPTIGTVNVHSSLLPKYRGSAPINWAIMEGETVTGVTTMMTDKGLDTGDILLQKKMEILPGETAEELTARMAPVGAALLLETIRRIQAGDCPRVPQNEVEMSYFPMLKKEMGEIDWRMSAHSIVCRVRGLTPWPGCYMLLDNGEILKVWTAEEVQGERHAPGTVISADPKAGLVIAADENYVRIVDMQAQGGKRMNARDYLRGHPLNAKVCVKGEEENNG